MKLFLTLILTTSFANIASASSCSKPELDRGCHTVYLGDSCHLDCIPKYRCDCPKQQSLNLQVDEETRNEIKKYLEQNTEWRCCGKEAGVDCCGHCCMQ